MNTCRRFSSMLRKSDKVRMNSFWLYPFWLYLTFNTVVALVKIIKSRKVARLFKYLVSPQLLQSVYEGEIWCLFTVTFLEKVEFCNSSQIYFLGVIGIQVVYASESHEDWLNNLVFLINTSCYCRASEVK